MAIRIIEIHAADEPEALNTEWFIVENQGQRPFTTRNCSLVVSKKGSKKKTTLGTMEPGFVIAPGEKVRVVTGHPGRKAHGTPPEDEIRVYNLFLNEPVLRSAGTVLSLMLRSLPVTKATYDPEGQAGLATT